MSFITWFFYISWPFSHLISCQSQNASPASSVFDTSGCVKRRVKGMAFNLVGGWATHLKNMLVKLDHLPRAENRKDVQPQPLFHANEFLQYI